MGFASDPVGRGFGSLARPGGNITGVTYWVGPEFEAKRLQLLKEAVPRAKKITVLATKEPQVASNLREAQKIAPALGVKLFVHEVGDADYDHALSKMVAEGAGALLIAVSPTLNRDQKLITGFAAKYRLPSICEWREDVEEGCLMAYGSSRSGLYRRVASYVDRLFKGANPADLPIEQPSKFELVINLKTAEALGLTIPPSLLQRADQVSE